MYMTHTLSSGYFIFSVSSGGKAIFISSDWIISGALTPGLSNCLQFSWKLKRDKGIIWEKAILFLYRLEVTYFEIAKE